MAIINWKREAINDLCAYNQQCAGIRNIDDRLRALAARKYSLGGGSFSADPVQGGSSRIEDRQLNCIVEEQRLRLARAAAEDIVGRVERGLAVLGDRERRVLELFYIQRQERHIERLMEELFIEQSRVYQLKDIALYAFTLAMYGVPAS